MKNQPTPRTVALTKEKQLELANRYAPFRLSGSNGGFCCLFFCYLSVIPFLFVFFYHAFPTTILLIVFLLALLSFIPCIFNRGELVFAEPVGPLLASMMLAFTALVFLGSMHLYWAHVQPMRALSFAREYKGVYPQLPAVAFTDAAFLQFSGNTTVDVTKGVNMKSLDAGLHTFCAAPIGNEASTGRVEFWAVGVDCCHENGKFECDDSGKAGAKNAYVMQDPTDPLFESIGKYIAPAIIRRDIFLQAIAKAEITKNIITPKSALLVRWTQLDKAELIQVELLRIILYCGVINIVVTALMAITLTRILHRFSQLRKAQRGEGMDSKFDLSARMEEAFMHMDDNKAQATLLLDMSKIVERPPITKTDTCIMGIIIPYMVMMLSVLLTTYSGCFRNNHHVYAPFLTVLGIAVFALILTPNRVVSGLYLLLVSTSGLYIGHENYNANMFHYCSVDNRRAYSDVAASASSDVYWDAGVVKFPATAYLSQKHSVGFLYQDTVYCVAPILSQDTCANVPIVATSQNQTSTPAQQTSGTTAATESADTGTPQDPSATSFLQRTSRMHAHLDLDLDRDEAGAAETASADTGAQQAQVAVAAGGTGGACNPKRVEFWAVGIGCCDSRQDFRCDGGKDTNAHSGIVVRATGAEEPGGGRDQFFKAISQSVAAYGLPPPERAVLIRWGKDTAALQGTYATRAGGVILITAMISFLANLMIGFGSYAYMKRMRTNELKEEQAEKIREEQDTGGEGTMNDMSFFSTAISQRDQLRV